MAERPTGTPCWVDISVPDVERAKEFYGGLLGWDCRTDPRPEAGGYTMCFLGELPAGAITPMWGEDARPGWTVYIATDDADATAEAVVAHGGMVFMEPMDVFDSGRLVVGADPSGAMFGAWQKGAHRGAETEYVPGALAWVECVARGAEAAGAFYAAVFGMQPVPYPGMDGYFIFQQDGVGCGGLMELNEQVSGAIGSHWRVFMGSADVDASYALAEELGGSQEIPPFDIPTIGRCAFVRDPFDVRLGIIQPAS